MAQTRTQILQRFNHKIAEGKPIIGGGAGTGISAKFEEAGGIDLIVIYNSGRFRMAGRGSLAGGVPVCGSSDVACGCAAWRPWRRPLSRFFFVFPAAVR
jgi:predicted TIM-barrel enzyme